MTIKIDIIKTEKGYNLRNSESRKLVGTIKAHSNDATHKNFFWESYEDWGCGWIDHCLKELKEKLSEKAYELGLDIEFINI